MQVLFTSMLNMKIRSDSLKTKSSPILLNLMNPINIHYVYKILIHRGGKDCGPKICLPTFGWSWASGHSRVVCVDACRLSESSGAFLVFK